MKTTDEACEIVFSRLGDKSAMLDKQRSFDYELKSNSLVQGGLDAAFQQLVDYMRTTDRKDTLAAIKSLFLTCIGWGVAIGREMEK